MNLFKNFNNQLILASHNKGKLVELQGLLTPYAINVLSAAELNLPEPEETGLTFIDNAVLKAQAAAMTANLPALSDDSGLAVDALDGAPGIYSARWAGPNKDFDMAMEKVELQLRYKDAKAPHQRKAAFVCALCLAWPNGDVQTFEGRVEGEIVYPPRGEKGFGYDPIFQPMGFEKTFAQMTPEEKHGYNNKGKPGLSHRAKAFELFVEAMLIQQQF